MALLASLLVLLALQGIVDLVEDVVADMLANGESLPDPITEKQYSGKLLLRIPPEQHRRLALEAQEARVSLKRYISAKLSAAQEKY